MLDIIFLLAIAVILAFGIGNFIKKIRNPSGRDRSVGYNSRVGKYRVKYPDGEYSQRFCQDVAEDYAKMFGGQVVPASEFKAQI